jgi:hypothetical protein
MIGIVGPLVRRPIVALMVGLPLVIACSDAGVAPAPTEPTTAGERAASATTAPVESPSGADGEQARVGDVALALDGCTLVVSRAEGEAERLDTRLEGDCRFVRQRDGSVQTSTSPAGDVVLVYTSIADPNGIDCDTRIRAFLVAPSGTEASSDEQRIAACLGGPVDRMMLEVFADGLQPDD